MNPKLLLHDLAKLLVVDITLLSDDFELNSHSNWDSLTVINLLGIINEHYKVKASISEVMQCKTIGDLFKVIEEKMGNKDSIIAKGEPVAFKRIQISSGYLSSSIQERFWFLNEAAENKAIYNLPIVLELAGEPNLRALETAFNSLLKKHTSLRTTLYWQDDCLLQKINNLEPIVITPVFTKKKGIAALIKKIIEQPFDLGKGPLFRVELLKESEDKHILVIVLHHIISDYYSIGILLKELEIFYKGYVQERIPNISSLAYEYIDYAGWQRSFLKSDIFGSKISFWRKYLSGLDETFNLKALENHSLASRCNKSSNIYELILNNETISSFRDWCHSLGISLFTGLLTIYSILLNKTYDQENMLIGCPIANREKLINQDIVGSVSNLLPVSISIDRSQTVSQLATQIWQNLLNTFENSEVPFDEIIKAINHKQLNPNIFQTLFNYLGANFHELTLPNLTIEQNIHCNKNIEFPLILEIKETKQGLIIYFKYATEYFGQETISHLAKSFQRFIKQIKKYEQKTIGSLKFRKQKSETLNIYLLSNYTVDPIRPALSLSFADLGYCPSVKVGPYNQIIQELLNPESFLYGEREGINYLLIRLSDIGQSFGSIVDLKSFKKRLSTFSNLLLNGLKQYELQGYKPLWVVLTPPNRQSLFDRDKREVLQHVSNRIMKHLKTFKKARFISESVVFNDHFLLGVDDIEADKIGHIPYSESYYIGLGVALAKAYIKRYEQPKKAIFVDCDNTLWDGIIGEQGIENIKVTPYQQAFQRALKSLSAKGTLIALCSKNNEKEVLNVFDYRKNSSQIVTVPKELPRWRLKHLGVISSQTLEKIIAFLSELDEVNETHAYQNNQTASSLINLKNLPDIAIVNESLIPEKFKKLDEPCYLCFEVDSVEQELSLLTEDCEVVSFDIHQPCLDGDVFALINTPVGLIKLIQSKNSVQDNGMQHKSIGICVKALNKAKEFILNKFGSSVEPSEYFDINGQKFIKIKTQNFSIELSEDETNCTGFLSGSFYYLQEIYEIPPQKEKLIDLGYSQVLVDQINELKLYSPLGLFKFCSKNLETPDQMILSLDDIVAHRINWQQKSTNIKSLAQELNIGLDSCVFIDDSNLECAEVKEYCPEVLTFCLPKEPGAIAGFLKRVELFNITDEVTAEDLRRTQMYQEERQRKQALTESLTYAEFLEKLAVVITIHLAKDQELSRLSQLTARTNQFNAFKRIYEESEIRQYQLEGGTVLSIGVEDCFGKYGLTGAVFYHEIDSTLSVDQLLLSCRVLGRGVEYKILRELGNRAFQLKKDFIQIKFSDSGRNQVIRSFFEKISGVFDQDKCVWSTQKLLSLAFEMSEPVASSAIIQTSQTSNNNGFSNGRKGAMLQNIAVNHSKIESFRTRLLPILDNSSIQNAGGSRHIGPSTEMERNIALIWQELLGIKEIGRFDDFFQLGGHSLLLVRCLIRIRENLRVEVTLKTLFKYPRLNQLASYLETVEKNIYKIPKIEKHAVLEQDLFPLSTSQEWMLWLLKNQNTCSFLHNIPIALEIKGLLKQDTLERACKVIIERYDILRTRLVELNANMYQEISSFTAFELVVDQSLRNLPIEKQRKLLKSTISQDVRIPFELNKAPLFRGHLYVLSEVHSILLFTFHHFIVDGWSIVIFLNELTTTYNKLLMNQRFLANIELQYADYTVWQRNSLPAELLHQQRLYWLNLLKDAPHKISLPYDFKRPTSPSYIGSCVRFKIDRLLTEKIASFNKCFNSTNFMTLFTVFSALLYCASDEQDIVIGTSVANRQYEGIEKIFGLVMHNVGLRLKFCKKVTFENLLIQVINLVQAAQDNSCIPYEQLINDLNIPLESNYHPLFQVMFSYKSIGQNIKMSNLEVSEYPVGQDILRYDLRLRIYDQGNVINLKLEYAKDLFKYSTAKKIQEAFIDFLEVSISRPKLPIIEQSTWSSIKD